MKLWYLIQPDLLATIRREIQENFPTLYLVLENNKVYIRGTLLLCKESEQIIDRYQIEIELLDDYPRSVPLVRETGGRIEKIPDRHFYSDSQIACLFFRDERFRYYPKGTTLTKFIETVVKRFFYWQTDYDLNGGKSSFGARGHFALGVYEFYSEELGIENPHEILKFLKYLSIKKTNRGWRCYCGSGKKINACHLAKLNDLRAKVTLTDARKSLDELSLAINRAKGIKG